MANEGQFQCTFWCSVLSNIAMTPCLTACPTVSMHLLVLSAFQLDVHDPERARKTVDVSMHLLVLSAFQPGITPRP